jgi:hypothetical protein
MQRRYSHVPGFIILLCMFFSTGCQSAMNANAASKNPISNQDLSRPFTFVKHNLGVHCFNVYGCTVYYNDGFVIQNDEAELSPPSKNEPKNLSAGYIAISNFPSPAKLSWKSKDGTALRAEIDIGEIFKDEIIRHNVPKEDLPTETIAGSEYPDILLVINDRTVSVYMRAKMYTKDQPGKPGRIVWDAIQAFSKTY